MKSIKEVGDLKGKRVLVRVDFNVPLGDDGVVDENEAWRITAALPTIKYLLENDAKIILMSHLGRPEGQVVEDMRLGPVQDRLSEMLNLSVTKTPDCVGDIAQKAVDNMQEGEIILLENLRFYSEEEANDMEFAKKLAALGDIYVNEAFSASHRAHASVESITHLLPSYAGLGLEKEISALSKVIDSPVRPATIIMGGLKAETKLPVINFLLDKFDNILIGGVIANFLLEADGIDIGKSVKDDLDINEAKKIDLKNPKIHIPVDVVTDNPDKKDVNLVTEAVGNFRILDIGEKSLEEYKEIIRKSGTVVWNGSVGLFEKEEYARGTREIAKAMAESSAETIIGGGDTILALVNFGYIDDMKHVSTGGGAMLEFLSGKKLPGIEALK
ncbi:MAG: phosphoglycerate kinase [Candidatus Pacebacteria bacterium]|nr:phosphoglycerate kinase [Candidatus Paceibacterota bacterium]